MTAQPKHGYDGEPPVFVESRDFVFVEGPGHERIREPVKGPQNINTDRIRWLFEHRVIEDHHHQAAVRLQRDWEVSLIMPMAQIGAVVGGGGRSDYTPAHVKIEASRRFHDAMRAMGGKGSKIVDLVALQAMSVQKAAASMRVHNLKAQGMLIVALDILASHYGIG